MADFCKQCSIALYGEDSGDFKNLGPKCSPGCGYPVLCEGCGPTLVNEEGECIDPNCFEHHGAKDDEPPA